MKYQSCLLLVCLIFCSFDYGDILKINLPTNTPEKQVVISSRFRKVSYLPLETTNDCLLGVTHVRKIQDYILAWDANNCFLFSAKNGKFIRRIGHKGDDPKAVFTYYDNLYNPYNRLVYFYAIGFSLVKYDLNGEYVGKVKIPLCTGASPQLIEVIDSTTLCGFFANRGGEEKKRIVLFDDNGNVKKEYPNYHFVKSKIYIIDTSDGLTYRYKDNVYFKERFTDNVEEGKVILNTYKEVVEKAIQLKNKGISPESDEAIELASKWWAMIMEFTKGDLTLLTKLMEFNDNKENWDQEMANKQKEIDDYIGSAIDKYLRIQGMEFPTEELNNDNK